MSDEQRPEHGQCGKCGGPGPTLVFRSEIRSVRACYHCLARIMRDAEAAGVDYTIE